MAKKYGVDGAILIQHFQYAISHHREKGTHFHEGRYWTYDSLDHLTSLYPFWTKDIIRRIIKHLKLKEVLITGNFNKHSYDRTRWFAFKDEEKFLPVDNSVDKCQNTVDNPVDNYGIKKSEKTQNSKNKSQYGSHLSSTKSLETGHHVHVGVSPHAFGDFTTTIPIYTSIYSSIEEGGFANNNKGGSSNKFDLRKVGEKQPHVHGSGFRVLSKSPHVQQKRFARKITHEYVLNPSIRKKLQNLGYGDSYIDKQICKLIRYHQDNPQIILNEHSCVLGWFKNSKNRKN